ncbi:MAG: MBL fold metallo-hydrolase [Candidatus Omnitrophota bacterium]
MPEKSNIIVTQMPLGPMENFLYFIGDAKTREVALVDPAWDVPFLIKKAAEQDLKVTSVFLTHGHPDHVNGLDKFLSKHDVPVYISQHEAALFMPKHKNIKHIKPNEKLKTGNIEWLCLHTPGHSSGCQCFLSENILIAGDTLFIDGCGRCDLPGSDPKAMYHSLHEVILKLPEETIVYPGHDYGRFPFAPLKTLKKTNAYLQCKSLEEFLTERMGIGF